MPSPKSESFATPPDSRNPRQSCPVCHNIDRNRIIYWKGGPSRHRMFKRYFQNSDYHALPIPLKDLKFSASRECPLCVIVFEIFRWLARTKAAGLNAIYRANVEICVPFDARYPVVLTYSWFPGPNAPIPRQYDLQISVPSKCYRLPWTTLNVGHQVPGNPKMSLFRVKTWLHDCLERHGQGKCKTAADRLPGSTPRRLLSLGNNRNQVRLVDDLNGIPTPYMALSYCWGTAPNIITNSANYRQHVHDIPWEVLPATYRDAITLTKALGYRYLWIDALCIVQDDEKDWNHEASHMADIYSGAILVISAANANHVGFGFLNERPGSRTFRNKLKKQRDASEPARVLVPEPTHVLVQEPTVHNNIIGNPALEEQWPVFRRAWTLQERMLATRLVHFAAGEIIWECATMCACECGHLEATSAVTSRQRYDLASLDRMGDGERANLWDELALAYQNRRLSRDGDRLSALSGLAHRFQNDGLGRYLGGLWSNFSISMLLWEVKRGRKSTGYVAPSWSWASVQGSLTRNDPIEHNDAFQAVLEDAHCELATADSCGTITRRSSYITLSAPCLDGTIVRSERNGHPMVQLTPEIQAFLVSDVDIEEAQIGGTVKCLFPRGLETGASGFYIEALVLGVSKEMVDYQRIGIVHIRKHSWRRHQDRGEELCLVTQTVKII